MFLNFIKDFSLKKIVKKTLSNYKAVASNGEIATVGIVLDETYFKDKEALIGKLVQAGVKRSNIETLSYLDKLKKGEQPDCCHFTRKDITSDGDFSKDDVKAFINKSFDLLISYYDVAKPPLVLATLKSGAKFKVGFATVDNRLNSFIIASQAERYEEFTEELIKYLKILNKL
ncbi:hypothetical protein AM493_19785 [Flavobacterium akiainvivens]|uniref:Uncharacterized protein n=1 Tax=Flavobacterium akiainvivens TaxID=1202724 RepID=A0A0M8MKH0_9FLAO|nr:hypothetical protein [Flavobacterium akiainvivens]KOS08041.1 hypothetical protein AM493_19785 [Flavobacterium akiainvivens]SFQ62269.1 hypothetical protein SAMN05444144_110102 [Flavobacterium akiainvivens]